MITITEILGTDSIAGSRSIINTNFTNLKTGVDALQDSLSASGQSLSLKNGVNPTIILTGSTGAIEANTLTLTGAISTNGNISGVSLNISGASTLAGTVTVGSTATFNGKVLTTKAKGNSGGIGLAPYTMDQSISITDKYLVSLDFSANTGFDYFSVPDGFPGQEILLRCVSNSSGTDRVILNEGESAELNVIFTSPYATGKYYFDGSDWLTMHESL